MPAALGDCAVRLPTLLPKGRYTEAGMTDQVGPRFKWADYTPTEAKGGRTPNQWPDYFGGGSGVPGPAMGFGAQVSKSCCLPGPPAEEVGGWEPQTLWPTTPTSPDVEAGGYSFGLPCEVPQPVAPAPSKSAHHPSMHAPAQPPLPPHLGKFSAYAALALDLGVTFGDTAMKPPKARGHQLKNSALSIKGRDVERGSPPAPLQMQRVMTLQPAMPQQPLLPQHQLRQQPLTPLGAGNCSALSPLPVKVPAVPGSALHAAGKCRPCAWFWKPKGCMNAQDCSYCHLCPEGELKARKKSKVTAMRMGALTPVRSVSQAGAARRLRLAPLLGGDV